jgi:hypothetical protein
MPDGAPANAPRADDTSKPAAASGLEIAAKLATVMEIEPVGLMRVPRGRSYIAPPSKYLPAWSKLGADGRPAAFAN